MSKRVIKFDSVSSIKQELKNCNIIQSELLLQSANEDLKHRFLTTLAPKVGYLDHDIMGALTFQIGFKENENQSLLEANPLTLDNFLSELLNPGQIFSANRSLTQCLDFLFKMYAINCRSISIKDIYSEFFKNLMPVDKNSEKIST